MQTAASIRRDIATLEAQLADWSQRYPTGDAEIEINERIADLRAELEKIEHPEWFADEQAAEHRVAA